MVAATSPQAVSATTPATRQPTCACAALPMKSSLAARRTMASAACLCGSRLKCSYICCKPSTASPVIQTTRPGPARLEPLSKRRRGRRRLLCRDVLRAPFSMSEPFSFMRAIPATSRTIRKCVSRRRFLVRRRQRDGRVGSGASRTPRGHARGSLMRSPACGSCHGARMK